MKATFKRLQRLEKRHRDSAESAFEVYIRQRLEAARLRCGMQRASPESLAQSRGRGIVAILHSGRSRAAEGREATVGPSEPKCRAVLNPNVRPYLNCE